MKNNLQVFYNAEFGEIRTTMIHNEPYFIGEDVANALGYPKTNALSVHVDECDILNWSITDNLGKIQKTTVINETGLSNLIFSSKSPTAKQFEKWIKNNVLPSMKEEKQIITEDNLMVFDNPEFGQLRMIYVDGKQYFMANDVAKALGYSNCPKAVRTHCKGVTEMDTPTNGGVQSVKFIPEGDVYRLIIRSKLPKAEEFERWVFDKVLPSMKEEKQVITDNHLMIFEGNQVEVFEWNGQVLFNPYHVGKCLEVGESAVKMAMSKMNEKQVIKLKNSEVNNIDFRKLNNAGENFLTQSGVYKLIFKSRKPEAERFQDWVTDEVLPSIRNHGIYATDNVIDTILKNPDFGIQLLSQLKEEREEKEKLKTENLQQKQMIGELKSKADYTDMILQSKELVTITQIAKDYGMSGTKMNELLHTLKVQYKQNGQWLLYSCYHSKGYTHSETIHFKHSNGRADTKMVTKWTQKGRLFLYELLKKSDIFPMIEKSIVA